MLDAITLDELWTENCDYSLKNVYSIRNLFSS